MKLDEMKKELERLENENKEAIEISREFAQLVEEFRAGLKLSNESVIELATSLYSKTLENEKLASTIKDLEKRVLILSELPVKVGDTVYSYDKVLNEICPLFITAITFDSKNNWKCSVYEETYKQISSFKSHNIGMDVAWTLEDANKFLRETI